MLFEKENNPEGLVWKFDKLKTLEVLYMNITVSTDVPMLTPFYRKKLNPMQINLVACKAVPYKTEPKYKPVYAIFKFVDGRSFKT